MDLKVIIALLSFCVTSVFEQTDGYKILGLFPYYGQSHFIMFESIMKELARRGHTVHVVSHYPLEEPLENYVDLSLAGSVPLPNNQIKFEIIQSGFDFLYMKEMEALYRLSEENMKVMNADTMLNLLNSTETYDLIITESFILDAALGFVHKFKAPFIYLSSCSILPWTSQLVANPLNPSYNPILISSYSSRMSFWERVHNTLALASSLFVWRTQIISRNEEKMREFFGKDVPPLLDIAYNASLVLVNSHYSIFGAKPAVPGVVEVAGVHVTQPNQLPQDIKEFIDSSPNGVIYFCMGSLLRAATIPEEKKKAFLDAFSKVKERVLWKFEDENIPGLPDNVLVKKWMPQRDILAHSKVKLFISHGGLFGTIEALHEAKPIIGIPMFGDQKMNIRSLEAEGMAVYLSFDSISSESILKAITEALEPQYAENAKRLSSLYHDRPLKPLDTAVYYIEHIIRHKGNSRLRSPSVNMPFYQYFLVDVIAFISLVILTIIFIFAYMFIKILRVFKTAKSEKLKNQ